MTTTTEKPPLIDLGITPLLKKCKLDHLRTKFLPMMVKKFSNVPRNEIKDMDFLESDNLFRYVFHLVVSYTTDDFFAEDDEFRRQQYRVILEQPRMFYTFRKILEITSAKYPTESSEPLRDQMLDFDARISITVCRLLVSGSDRLEVFAMKMSFEPLLMELFAAFVKKARLGYFEETHGLGTMMILSSVFTNIHNCALYQFNHKRMIQAGILDAILPYLEKQNGAYDLHVVQCVAFLADDKDAHLFKMKKETITDELVPKLKEGMTTKRRVAGGWHVLELIKGLGRLALNEDNRTVMNECGGVTVLLELVRSEVLEEQYEAVSALRKLSIDPKIADTIADDSDAMKRITELLATAPTSYKEEAFGLLNRCKARTLPNQDVD